MTNHIFKLDLLEHHYLKAAARFNKTRLTLKSKKTHKLIPFDLDQDEAKKLINSVKSDIFDKKLHNALTKYQRELKKLIKASKPSKKVTDDEVKFLKSLDIEKISKIRVVKLLSKIYPSNLLQTNRDDYKFISEWIYLALTDKSNELNPSLFYTQLSSDENNWYSKLMNHKGFKELNETIVSSFSLINGPVEKKTKADKELLKKEEQDISSDEESDDESDDDSDGGSESDSDEEYAHVETQDLGSDQEEYDFSEFDNLVAGSEDEDDGAVVLDDGINYNEITDTEPSDEEKESEDELFEAAPAKETKVKEKKEKKESKKEKKKGKDHKLPELMGGYFSASDGEEPEDDKLVEEITKPQRKNRRGQRARQKIWELKYGKGANHIKKEKEEYQKAREQKQREFEERQRKREEKAKRGEALTGGNQKPLGTRHQRPSNGESVSVTPSAAPSKPFVHPSWEAKLKQKEAEKNVKFAGKKVKFD